MSDESRGVDILGIKPIAESINKVTEATVEGAAAFLSRICLPAAEEFGLLLRDRVRDWRASNVAAIAAGAQQLLSQQNQGDVHAHPRLVAEILDEGSWNNDSVVQDLWSGLLSSSCTETGDDDSNLIFITLLSNLTRLQARLLNYICETAHKYAAPNGLIQADEFFVTLEQLIEITGESDFHRLDREIDHLREIGLIDGGFVATLETTASLCPLSIALHMYVRCQGSRLSPAEYFKLPMPEKGTGVPESGRASKSAD